MEARKPGDVIEGFRVLSELGRGAASIIYLAQDERTKQVRALKHVVKENAKDQRFLDQAESEYQVASRLKHPGIRRIERMFKKKAGLISVKELFLVMELVDGASMEVSPPSTHVEAVDIFHQVAEALSYMHERGFVHADMKPNNVIVSDKGVAKIIDLGQSCKTGAVKPRIQGTPDYIAPEQVHRRPITPKTDVYNMGATMYWVLAGAHIPTALPKDNSLLGSLDDNLIERPKPVIELNPGVDKRLNALVMECVEVDPDRRPGSMHDVADRLNLVLGILRTQQGRGRREDESSNQAAS